MNWSIYGDPDSPVLMIPFIFSGVAICLSAAIAALARWGGARYILALAGAAFSSALTIFAQNLVVSEHSEFAARMLALFILLVPAFFALYQLLQLRAEERGYGAFRAAPVVVMSLCGAWIPVMIAIGAKGLVFGTAFFSLVLSITLFVVAYAMEKKRGRGSSPTALFIGAYSALVFGSLMPAVGMIGILPGELAGAMYVAASAGAAAMLAGTTLTGKGKETAIATNRVLKLTAKSLEDENRQLTDTAARLEFERKRLQERRAELEKENRQAEDRIRELCKTADAFYTLGQSIDYARRIQQALSPSEKKLRQTIGESFVLNLPRDKVSGDFFWCMKFDDGWSLLCVADCTGHGVPGAFMSALGTMLLTQIVAERGIRRPDQVLYAMDSDLRGALSSSGGDIQDGMEAAIVLFSPSRNQAIFSGAKLPLIKTSAGVCTRIDSTRRTIGGRKNDKAPSFESVTISLKSGDKLYLYSDGFQDQLGGPSDRRYLSGRFKDTVEWISGLPMADQREALFKSHMQWRLNRDQTDDIMIVGFQV
jgi:serine phosphatase RsbU (regulator of sigma subunit)